MTISIAISSLEVVILYVAQCSGRHCGLMVSALDSGLNGPGSGTGGGTMCVLGQDTLLS